MLHKNIKRIIFNIFVDGAAFKSLTDIIMQAIGLINITLCANSLTQVVSYKATSDPDSNTPHTKFY